LFFRETLILTLVSFLLSISLCSRSPIFINVSLTDTCGRVFTIRPAAGFLQPQACPICIPTTTERFRRHSRAAAEGSWRTAQTWRKLQAGSAASGGGSGHIGHPSTSGHPSQAGFVFTISSRCLQNNRLAPGGNYSAAYILFFIRASGWTGLARTVTAE
jgi:hypothetical protein